MDFSAEFRWKNDALGLYSSKGIAVNPKQWGQSKISFGMAARRRDGLAEF
jgi:hypothetical protein